MRQDNVENKLSDIFANRIASLARSVLLANYINSFWDNWKITYISSRDKNSKNDANIVDNNDNIVEKQKKNMENSNNVNF